MASKTVNSGTYSQLRMVATKINQSAAGLWWDVDWDLYFEERVSAPATYGLTPTSWSVSVTGEGTEGSGTFTFDWRPSGLQFKHIASGTTRVSANANGTPPSGFKVTGSIGNTGTSGGGGPTSAAVALTLPVLTVLPDVPDDVAAARVSDASVNVTWTQTAASNGAPTGHTVRRKINDGAWADAVTIAPATSTALAAAANQKLVYGVKATNAAGDTAWSDDSPAIFTTPAAPTDVAAVKTGADIVIGWTPHVAFTEHEHVIEHGVDVAGVVTWDGSPLTVVPGGTSTYTDVAPDAGDRHVYRVRARNTDVAALSSATVTSNVVQLLTAPAKPTVTPPPAFADKAATFRLAWVHNSIDSSAQTKRQIRYSLDGGSSWTTGAKTASTDLFADFAGGTWAANDAVTFQVRTKGAYDSGADGDASYSPWSDSVTVTFKTKPVATITAPADSGTLTSAALNVVLGFAQAEAATFVSATIGLYDGATLLEQRVSTALAGTAFTTRLADGVTYTVKATVTDSNGVTSAQATSTFDVDYTEPVVAVVDAVYLPDSGIMQLTLTIPAAGGGYAAAVDVDVDRTIDGVTETVVSHYPSASSLTVLDTTPTIHGVNLYRVTTRSADGATSVAELELATAEDEWAFLSKGAGYESIVRFELAPGLKSTPTVDAALVKAAGRRRPIALYATTGDLVVTGTGALADGYGSTPDELEAFLLLPGKGCYRDPTGRRIFGLITGSLNRDNADTGQLSYTITETD